MTQIRAPFTYFQNLPTELSYSRKYLRQSRILLALVPGYHSKQTKRNADSVTLPGVRFRVCSVMTPLKSQFSLFMHSIAEGHLT